MPFEWKIYAGLSSEQPWKVRAIFPESVLGLKWRLGASVFGSQYFDWELELPSMELIWRRQLLLNTDILQTHNPALLRTHVDIWDGKDWDLNLIMKAGRRAMPRRRREILILSSKTSQAKTATQTIKQSGDRRFLRKSS